MSDAAGRPVESLLDATRELAGELGEVVPRLIDRSRRQIRFAVVLAERVRCAAAEQRAARAEPLPGPDTAPGPHGSVEAPLAPSPPPQDPEAAAGLAIPDYDELAASQVLPRLEGLAADELAAVDAYERAHRSRRTILNRIAQLRS